MSDTDDRLKAMKNLSTSFLFNYGMMCGTLNAIKGLLAAGDYKTLSHLDLEYFHQRKFVGVGHAMARLMDDSMSVRKEDLGPYKGKDS